MDWVTAGDRITSARYREVLAPFGLGDEMRVALVSGAVLGGALSAPNRVGEGVRRHRAGLVRRVAPDLANGLRRSFMLYSHGTSAPASARGSSSWTRTWRSSRMNPAAEAFLADIMDADWPAHLALPVTIFAAAAAQLAADHREQIAPPTVTRLRGRSGGWITVHTSPLRGGTAATGGSGPRLGRRRPRRAR